MNLRTWKRKLLFRKYNLYYVNETLTRYTILMRMKEITILIPLYNTIVTRIMETKIIIVINENEK